MEAEALQQIQNTASIGFIFKHVAVTPDCHDGNGVHHNFTQSTTC